MSHALHCFRNGFFIHDASGTESHFQAQTLFYHIFQNLNLHLTHDLGSDFLGLFLPNQMQQWFFLF